MTEFSHLDLTTSAWAVAPLESSAAGRPLMDAISAASIRLLHAFEQQGLANSAWAIAPIAVRDPPLRDALSASAIRTITE